MQFKPGTLHTRIPSATFSPQPLTFRVGLQGKTQAHRFSFILIHISLYPSFSVFFFCTPTDRYTCFLCSIVQSLWNAACFMQKQGCRHSDDWMTNYRIHDFLAHLPACMHTDRWYRGSVRVTPLPDFFGSPWRCHKPGGWWRIIEVKLSNATRVKLERGG